MAIFALMFLYLSNNPIKLRHIVYGTLFLLVMRTFSSYRAIGVVSIESVLGLGINDLALATHWGGVFVSNAICFDLIESVWSINFRFSSLIGMLTCYIPYSITPFKEIYLNVEALKITEIPGAGGFPTLFFYVSGGIIGVLFFSSLFFFMPYFVRNLRYFALIQVLFWGSFPRWFPYSITLYIKFLVITFIIIFIYEFTTCRFKLFNNEK